MADFVAKVGEEQLASKKMRNNQIWTDGFLNQHCAQTLILSQCCLLGARGEAGLRFERRSRRASRRYGRVHSWPCLQAGIPRNSGNESD
jgi:hypothetical protein